MQKFGPSRKSSTCSVAIDRTSKLAFVELHEKATTSERLSSSLHRSRVFPVHTVLTDDGGIQFTTPGAGGSAVPEIRKAMAKGDLFRAHAFEHACAKTKVDHRTTKPRYPLTNGQSLPAQAGVDRMNRTIKDATSDASTKTITISFDAPSPTSSPPMTSDGE